MNNKVGIILIIILAFILCGESYIIFNNQGEIKEQEKDNNPEENNYIDDSIKLISTIKEDDETIIQNYEIILNGTPKELKRIFQLKEEEYYPYLTQKINNEEVFVNEINEVNFNIDDIKKQFNETDFKILIGADNKKYLIISSLYEQIQIFNYNFELIQYIPSENELDHSISTWNSTQHMQIVRLENDNNPFYQNEFNSSIYNRSNIKIEKDKFYYLTIIFDYDKNFEEGNYGILEERVYTINNNKLEYKLLNSYKIIEAASLP